MSDKPLIAIVGRPNVGKSTLFNRLIGRRDALVFDEPGVTRDRRYGETEWDGFEFAVVDTGGLEFEAKTPLTRQMSRQALKGIEEADCVILLMDGRAGVTHLDREWVERTRKIDKPKVFVVNKVDSARQEEGLGDFYALGIEPLFTVSSETSRGVGELLDHVVSIIKRGTPSVGATRCGRPQTGSGEGQPSFDSAQDRHGAAPTADEIRISIIGRPNVGKSTLFNRLVGEERVIVDDVPGTTRDSVDTLVRYNHVPFCLVDTAGLRRRGRIEKVVEKFSVAKSLQSIDRSDVSLLLLDALEGVTDQDAHVAGEALKKGKGLFLLVNKWDEAAKGKTVEGFKQEIKRTFHFVPFSPVHFISAKTGKGCARILPILFRMREQLTKKIPTPLLNRVFRRIVEEHPLPTHRGRNIRMLYATQTGMCPPAFTVFSNEPAKIHFSYERYLSNALREALGLTDVPVKIVFRKSR